MLPITAYSTNILDWSFAAFELNSKDLELPITQEDLSLISERLPINKIKNIKGETLVIVGE